VMLNCKLCDEDGGMRLGPEAKAPSKWREASPRAKARCYSGDEGCETPGAG
jgi:hypothetical protein